MEEAETKGRFSFLYNCLYLSKGIHKLSLVCLGVSKSKHKRILIKKNVRKVCKIVNFEICEKNFHFKLKKPTKYLK